MHNRFIVLNFLKNFFLIFSGIYAFLALFDYFFAEEVFMKNNFFQSFFLAFIVMMLNYYVDYKRLIFFGCIAGKSEYWQRKYVLEGTAELDRRSVSDFLNQDPFVSKIIVKEGLFLFSIDRSNFLTPLKGKLEITNQLVKIHFNNSYFFHFGAASAIALYSFLDRMEVYMYTDTE